GKPMSGRMTVEFTGRPVTIVRESNRAGLMQGFQAFYEDTGELCTLLTARNCGQVLLGMGEDAFLSSAMIDGLDMTRPSSELSELILSMAQTGDTNARCGTALKTLARWRLDLNSGNGHGEQPRLEEDCRAAEKRLAEIAAMEKETAVQRVQTEKLQAEADKARETYEKIYLVYAGKMVGEESQLRILKADSEKRIRNLKDGLPDEILLREAEEALYGYEGAVRLEREKRSDMPYVDSDFKHKLREVDERKTTEEVERNRVTRPRIRWTALLLALLLAVAAAGTALSGADFGPLTQYMPYVLSGMAALALLLSFLGSVPRLDDPDEDYDESRQQLALEHRRTVDDQHMAASVLQEEYDTAMRAARKLWPNVETIEQAGEWIRAARDDWQALRREQSKLQDILVQMKRLSDSAPKDESHKGEVDTARIRAAQARRAAEDAQQVLAQMEGRLQAYGDKNEWQAALAKARLGLEQTQMQLDAIRLAEETIKSENASLSARISPQITELAQQYLAYLTSDSYKEIKLDSSLRARCAGDDGTLLDALRLSSGTRDQLYFALRLAVCQVLSHRESIPLLLDDPFLTWDNKRMERGLRLLQTLSKDRQIILLTCRQAGRLAITRKEE
ncbi:MAG: ATP-binding protein, partial [Butyricicoccus sp.]